jgi:multidrug resistance efflux pump
MDDPRLNTSPDEAVFAVDNWPMRLDALRNQLKKAQKLLTQYRAALRLARTEIERRNHSLLTLPWKLPRRRWGQSYSLTPIPKI